MLQTPATCKREPILLLARKLSSMDRYLKVNRGAFLYNEWEMWGTCGLSNSCVDMYIIPPMNVWACAVAVTMENKWG